MRSGRLRRLALPAAGVGLLALLALWPRLAPSGPEPPDPTPRPVVAGAAAQTASRTVPQRGERGDGIGQPGYTDGAEPATAPAPRKPKAAKPRDRKSRTRSPRARKPTAPAAPPVRSAPSTWAPVTPPPAPPSPAREFGWP